MQKTYKEPFEPNPEDLKLRIRRLKWMQYYGFNSRVIASVLQHDQPPFETLEKLVESIGPDKTYDRIKDILAKTEYDNECENNGSRSQKN